MYLTSQICNIRKRERGSDSTNFLVNYTHSPIVYTQGIVEGPLLAGWHRKTLAAFAVLPTDHPATQSHTPSVAVIIIIIADVGISHPTAPDENSSPTTRQG